MTDPYVWIDPWAEFDRLERRARDAHRDGQESVMRELVRRDEKLYHLELDRCVSDLAHHIALEQVRPHMLAHHREYLEAQRQTKLLSEQLFLVAKPLVNFIHANGELSGRMDMVPRGNTYENLFTVTVHTTRPFDYHVRMSPMDALP